MSSVGLASKGIIHTSNSLSNRHVRYSVCQLFLVKIVEIGQQNGRVKVRPLVFRHVIGPAL